MSSFADFNPVHTENGLEHNNCNMSNNIAQSKDYQIHAADKVVLVYKKACNIT